MKKTIKDFELKGKKVLIRCDFNVPIMDGKITDDNRIVESLKTIKYAIDNDAKVILFSHLGKIKEEKDKEKNSLREVASRLSQLLGKNVIFVPYTRGKELEEAISNMKEKEVLLFENTRYEDLDGKKESSNDKQLGKYWASLGDLFINDAFGTAHRAHASNVGIASNVESGIGFLIQKEIEELEKLFNPNKPFYVILGGAKISDKIEIVEALVKKADKILIGGGMAFTFLKAKGLNTGNSILDEDSIDFAKRMLKEHNDKIILCKDVKATREFNDSKNNIIIDIDKIEDGYIGLDIGPKTITFFSSELEKANTIFWNGTLGYSEFSNYEDGTKSILKKLTELNATTILGGGDTVAAAKTFGYKEKVTFASTGGGATLEYISGRTLPGIDIIDNK